MPVCNIPEMPHVGYAAADEGEGRTYDAEQAVPGETTIVRAHNPRAITVKGHSAREFARDGQQAIIDADGKEAELNHPAMILTETGELRLKRKVKGRVGVRRYESINPAYPPFELPEHEIAAEWPVVAVLTKTVLRSPVETVDEGPPPAPPKRRRR